MNTNPVGRFYTRVTRPDGEFVPDEESGSLDALGSTDCVVYDADAGSFGATFDETRDSATVAVVSVLATVLGRDPVELPPLYSSVESGALDGMCTNSASGRGKRTATTVQYLGFDVTVTSDGTIEAVPTDPGGDGEPGD